MKGGMKLGETTGAKKLEPNGENGWKKLRFLRLPEAADAAADDPPDDNPPSELVVTGTAPILFVLKTDGAPIGEVTLLAIGMTFNGVVADVTTGADIIGTCETAKSEPDKPVTSNEEPLVSG